MNLADEQLKMAHEFVFTKVDIKIFDDYKKQMKVALNRTGLKTYKLGLEIASRESEIARIKEAIQADKGILLFKRITEMGEVRFAISQSPDSENDTASNPDESLNEVHIPLDTLNYFY